MAAGPDPKSTTSAGPSSGRPRGHLVLYVTAFSALALLGTACYLFVGPYLEVRALIKRVHVSGERCALSDAELARLGGTGQAARKLGLYARLPARLVPNRGCAVEMLGGCGKDGLPVLETLLQDSDEEVRICAAHSVMKTHQPSSWRILKEALGSSSPSVRLWAAYGLGWLKEARSVDALLLALEKEPVPPVRRDLVLALGSIGDRRAVGPLISTLEDKDEHVRATAITALKWLGDPRAWPALMSRAKDPHAYVRGSAISTLGEVAYSQARELIIAALTTDADADVRGSAAKALGQSGDRSALDPLKTALEDPELVVKAEAERAIKLIEKREPPK